MTTNASYVLSDYTYDAESTTVLSSFYMLLIELISLILIIFAGAITGVAGIRYKRKRNRVLSSFDDERQDAEVSPHT